jgi:2-polyprenyl-6-methoxyphenol hydroxylase-like FAD-dependent oxidoreductase
MKFDIAVVGAGPAGLGFAIDASRRGAKVAVFERQEIPSDKACGEGILPPGLRALDRLGVLHRLDRDACSAIRGVRYVEPDGSTLEAPFPPPGGLAVRRTALSEALNARAREAGVQLFVPCAVHHHAQSDRQVVLETDQGPVEARWLVAADGLHSPIRRRERLLSAAPMQLRRFGARLHFRATPWTDLVEIHLSKGVEAYATPAGPCRVGVAVLWRVEAAAELGPTLRGANAEERASACRRLFESRFPALAARLTDAEPDSMLRGAGPLLQRVHRRVQGRVVLLGDAAGYIDAITGEGISLALEQASALARAMARALAQPQDASRALAHFERETRPALRRYGIGARALLVLADRPRLRRAVMGFLRTQPSLLARTVQWIVDAPSIEQKGRGTALPVATGEAGR